ENSPFDERTRLITSRSSVPVGVLLDKELERLDHVFMLVSSEDDAFLIRYAQLLINNSKSHLTILDVEGQLKKHPKTEKSIQSIKQNAPDRISLLSQQIIDQQFLENQDLMLISL